MIVKKSATGGEPIRYIPARHVEGKDWYVSYYAHDPYTNRMRRKRIKINHIRNIRERRRYARILCEDINLRLATGWSPFTHAQAPRGSTPILVAISAFLKSKEDHGVRPDTLRSYRSQCDKLITWLKLTDRATIAVAMFTRRHARDYMDHILATRKLRPVTFNNILTFGKVLFNWLKDRQYCPDCPFDAIERLREGTKRRKIIPTIWRERIHADLTIHHRDFLRSCMLQFYAQLRPREQSRVRLGDIDITRRIINVPREAAKTGIDRTVTIPEVLLPYLHEINFAHLPKSAVLVGHGFAPGAPPLTSTREWRRMWLRMAARIGLPVQYQFYSLRDSGIVYLIEQGVPINVVMRQAGHTDLQTTTKYVKHATRFADPDVSGISSGF